MTSTPELKSVSNSEYRDALNRLKEQGKDCLESSLFNDYVFRAESLDPKTIRFIENHLDQCSNCKSQVEEVKNNLDFYRSLPEFDI